MEAIPVNIWDDYADDGDIPSNKKIQMLAVVIAQLKTMDLDGATVVHSDDMILFRGLTHVRRERLVKELQALNLKFKDQPFRFYSES
jgi:hypothetical protein